MLALFDSVRHWLDGIAHLGTILAVAYLLYLLALTGWIMDEDRMVNVQARQDIPIGHKVALKDMAVGDTVSVGGYTFKLTGISEAKGPNYRADVGDVELIRDGKVLRTLHPEKRTYFSSTMPMTEAAIDTSLTRDVYVSLGERLSGDGAPAWAMRVYYKPFVSWIWGGAVLMALGGGLAALDRRYRKKRATAAANAAIAGVAA